MVRVAITSVDDTSLRAAASLAGHLAVEQVGLLGRRPPPGWGSRIVKISDTSGWDCELDSDSAPGLSDLASALARRLDVPLRIAVTRPGKPVKHGDRFVFPPPLGNLGISDIANGIEYAPVFGRFGGIGVASAEQILSVVDDRRFLEGVCMAAGALLPDQSPANHPEQYIARCEELGLVIASAVVNDL